MQNKFRKDFPFFSSDKPLIYFDNAATTQKPQAVIDAISHFYSYQNAPVHRGIYSLAEQATELYEEARQKVARYIGAFEDEVVFTKGTTESINFISATWASHLQQGDEVILTELEHHANIVPWIRLSQMHGIQLRYVPVNSDGTLHYEQYLSLLSSKTKLVSFTACSNALGTMVDIPFMINHAHRVGAKVLVDAAQIVGREKMDVHELNADFLVFSSHKMLGPTGIGVLFIARELHEAVEPYQVGGGMVFEVDLYKATWLKPPRKYEAGTPAIAEAVGFGAAVDYIKHNVALDVLRTHERTLSTKLYVALKSFSSVTVLSPSESHIVNFVSTRFHAHDIAAYVDQYGICVRAGNHCAQPLHKKLGVDSSVRVSFYLYNTEQEVDTLISALEKLFV